MSSKRSTRTRTGAECMRHAHIQIESLERRQMMTFGHRITFFGEAGQAVISFVSAAAPAEMLVDDEGRIVTASDAGLARLTSQGQPDEGFGTSGKAPLTGVSVR